MPKPIKSLELHYPVIQFLVIKVIWKKCYRKCGVWNQMKIWSSHLLDNLSNCLMNLKNFSGSWDNCLDCPASARIISSFDKSYVWEWHAVWMCFLYDWSMLFFILIALIQKQEQRVVWDGSKIIIKIPKHIQNWTRDFVELTVDNQCMPNTSYGALRKISIL